MKPFFPLRWARPGWALLGSVLLLASAPAARPQPAPAARPAATPPLVCPSPAPTDMTGAALFGNGTPASCTQAALQALLTAGGNIKCNCGPGPYTLTLTSTLIVPNKEAVLDGGNLLTISGNDAVRILRKEPARNQAEGSLLGLQNLNLVRGRVSSPADASDLGGAALASRGAYGSLRVVNVRFENNRTVFPNSVINPGNGISLNADACGAVHTVLYREAVFANCTFLANTGANGGAVGTIGSAQQFINCSFEDNEATGTGGTFDKGGSGGAVYVDGVDQNGVNNAMSVCGCTFRRNKAGYQAGALNVIFYAGKGSTDVIDRCAFEDNRCAADKGGALYHMNGPLTLTSSTFARNYSPVLGGGAWVSNTRLSLSNCTFAANEAVSGSNGLGGGLAIDGSGAEKAATVTNCTFAGNRAGNFASALMNGGILTLANSLFYNNLTGQQYQSNPYGGGTINKGSSLTVGAGNLQWPGTYAAPFGPQREDWLTPAVLVADAQLQPLADNGGPTPTMALSATSPAVNTGLAPGAPATDQRGQPRQGPADSGAFEYGAAPLPVSLLQFEATHEAPAVRLRWATAAELNCAYFVVERSPDGHTFTAVGRAEGQGTTSHRHDYTLLDLAPPPAPVLYYRLRQVDADGRQQLSAVHPFSRRAAPAFQVFPTVAEQGYVQYQYAGPPATRLEVLTPTGRCLLSRTGAAAAPGTLPVAALPAGWYVVRLTTAQGPATAWFLRP